MQDPRSTSTLELVVNEQYLQNMSQIDVSYQQVPCNISYFKECVIFSEKDPN